MRVIQLSLVITLSAFIAMAASPDNKSSATHCISCAAEGNNKNFINLKSIKNNVSSTYSDVAVGARKVFASTFKSCGSLDVPPLTRTYPETKRYVTVDPPYVPGETEREEAEKTRAIFGESNKSGYVRNHPILSKAQLFNPPKCDPRDQPPIYMFGGKGNYKNGVVKLHQDQTSDAVCKGLSYTVCASNYKTAKVKPVPVSGVDCSGFVMAALAAAGLKASKDQRNSQPLARFSTAGIQSLVAGHGDKDLTRLSCIKPAAMNRFNTLKSGDIITVAENHTVLIESVGSDPLGVNKAVKSGRCTRINYADFDFTVLQSTMSGNMGVNRVKVGGKSGSRSAYIIGSQLMAQLKAVARRVCESTLESNKKGEKFLPTVDGIYRKNNEFSHDVSKNFSIGRHVGRTNPECRLPKKAKLSGEECVESCFN